MDPRPHREPSVHRWRALPGARIFALWFLLPLLLLLGAELAVRRLERNSYARASWYEGVSDRLSSGRVDYLFIGSSRTATGLVPDVFAKEVRAERARLTGESSVDAVVCMNLGRGFSGAAAHYFGLRELLERHPEAMRGCTVAIETSAGIPAFTGTWDEAWYFPGNHQLIVDYLTPGDLRRFLGSEADFEGRAGVVAAFLGRGSRLIAGRRQLQQAVEWRGLDVLRTALEALGAGSAANAEGQLPAHRQLRVDAGGVRLQRDLVVERTSPEALAAQTPLRPWDDQVLCAAARMLREHGVRVVFHEVPVPSYVWTVNETEVRRADRRALGDWCQVRGIGRVVADLEVTDADFPDLSHLRVGRVEEYSRALARAMVVAETMER